ncbi:MAG: peptidase, partial [Gemella morbillorum]|nr:peptidase [Gemella morbillorum]
MTKNIDNNEIETLEGVYTQTTETEHQEENYSQPNKPKKNFLKPLIIG